MLGPPGKAFSSFKEGGREETSPSPSHWLQLGTLEAACVCPARQMLTLCLGGAGASWGEPRCQTHRPVWWWSRLPPPSSPAGARISKLPACLIFLGVQEERGVDLLTRRGLGVE